MTTKTVTLRLRAQDADKVNAALRGTGQQGERLARTLERSGRRGSRGLKAIDHAARDMRGRLQSTASHLPILGQSLAAIGPAGLGAAAGAAALFLGLQRGLSIARDAVRAFDDIAKRADTFNIATDSLQALRLAAIEEDVGVERLQVGMTRLANGAAQAASGTGELVTNLQRSHPELVRQIAASGTMENTLRLVTDALREAETETERTQIAYAAFGRSGLDLARMLSRAEDGIDGLIVRAREAGIVVDEHILRNAEVMENRLGVASEVIRVQLMTAFVDLAPVLVDSAEAFASVAKAVSDFVDAGRDLENQSTRRLQREAEALREVVEAQADAEERTTSTLETRLTILGAVARAMPGVLMAAREAQAAEAERMADPVTRLAEIERILAQRGESGPGGRPGGASNEGVGNLALDSDRQRATLEREAAQIRGELGNVTGLLAQREARLNEHVAAGTLTREEADQALGRYRQTLDAANDNVRRAREVTAAMQTPLQIYEARIAELNRLLAEGGLAHDVHARAVAAARSEYERSDPALRRAAEIREGLLTADQQFAREQAEIDALVAAGNLTREEANAYLEAFRQGLEESASATRDLRVEQEILDGVLTGQIKNWDDLGRVAMRVLTDIIRQQGEATAGTSGFFEFVGNVIGSVLGGGSGSAGASVPAKSASAPIVFSPGSASASVAASKVAGKMGAASMPAAAGGLKVSVFNYGGADVKVGERRSSGGGRELQVMINSGVRSDVQDGGFDGVMGSRFGARAKPGGR